MKSGRLHLFVLLVAALPVLVGGQPARADLTDAFRGLAAYEFGMPEVPLRLIADAVRAAAGAGADTAELEGHLVAVVTGDSTLEGKRFACRLLGEIGSPSSVQALAGLLTAPETFHAALIALEQMPHVEAAQALIARLDGADTETQAALLAALGRQGIPESASTVVAWLQNDNEEVAYAAAQALAAIDTPDACHLLLDAFAASAPSERGGLADASLACVQTLLAAGETDTAVKPLDALQESTSPAHIRIAAANLLMRLRPENAQDVLLDLLRDEDQAVSTGALMLARAMPTQVITEALVTMLEEVAEDRKPALLEVLGARGDTIALAAVQAHVHHESPDVRRAALRATGQLGNASLTRFLLERASSGPMDEQRIAREALTRMPGTEVNSRLLDIAKSRADEEMRVRAIALLTERGAAEAAKDLYNLVPTTGRTEPAAIRTESVRALRVLAPADMLVAILALCLDADAEAIKAVLPQTIAEIALRPETAAEDPARPVVAYLKSLPNAPDTDDTRRGAAQSILLDTLALIGSDEAFSEARTALDNPATEVRRAAVAALARFQRTEALDELQARINVETDAALRAQVYSAYLASLRNAKALPRREVDAHLAFALEQAATTAARRDFLAAATQLPSLKGLQLIEGLLEDEEVVAEASRAALQVSTALIGAQPEAARTRLEALVAQDHTPALAEEAATALQFMGTFEGHLMAWEMAGPYFEDYVMAHALFDLAFPPETDIESANWRVFPLLTDADPAYALEIDRVVGGEERVLFLRTFIVAESETDAVLELGTNDGCRIWWNGELIHTLNVGRPLIPGEDKLPVRLNAGVNTLMMAVFQHGGAWRATARLTNEAGAPLPGIMVYSVMPGQE